MKSLAVLAAAAAPLASALSLSVASTGGNATITTNQYGLLFEEIYNSGDGGLYGELIRNRAFQGGNINGVATLDRTTDYWTAVNGVTLAIDTSTPAVSTSLPYQMRMDVPTDTTDAVGFYNEGFWGFNIDSTKRYITSFYLRGTYHGVVNCYFQDALTGDQLSTVSLEVSQTAGQGWVQHMSATFMPTTTLAYPNVTFYFMFEDGASLAGESLYFNMLSVFKQTYDNRNNGLREDMATALAELGAKWIRLPGGSNMEGPYPPYYWKWNATIGSLLNRPGRPGVWGDINTDGFGILEQLQMTIDLGLEVVLAVWDGLYINDSIISEADIDPYVDQALNLLEFLLGDTSTTYGALRKSLGYSNPFTISYVEIGNEDNISNGESSYKAYRYMAFYTAIRALYPDLPLVSTINPAPSGLTGIDGTIDLHIYENEATFVNLFNTFDQASRKYPVFVGEYAAIRTGSHTSGQVGVQTFGMACAEAIFLLGCERNADVIIGTAYGALFKEYNEEPGTVAVMKHTANEILYSMSYYVQQLFGANVGTQTLPVTATGAGFGPVYWSAVLNADGQTVLKMVNYAGTTNPVTVTIEGSTATSATLYVMSAPSSASVNNLSGLGGTTSNITTSTLTGTAGTFSVPFTSGYQIVVLVV
ncbi:hypothetical protein SBRCBS47491_009299 [Sporothrix bragantina]|uniref:non-reducing end alpha-L-arabinofuranosidase n=1 Tax=Sporothrix bragantina TaxID=671064 RepID=A0ABP0CWA9_9PEZI